MKKYLIFIGMGLFLFSCSQKQKDEQKKMEETVETYVKSHLHDAKTYEKVTFEKLDSMKFEDTKMYKDMEAEKAKAKADVATLKTKLENLKQSGVKETDKVYQDAKADLAKAENKLGQIEQKAKDYEQKAKNKVYSLRHKYKAQKGKDTAPATYEEIFYIDQYGNVIEEDYIW